MKRWNNTQAGVIAALVILFAVVTISLFVQEATGAQTPEYQRLADVSSIFAMQPTTITCSKPGEDKILDTQAWGYVYLAIPEVHMGVYLCDAAMHIADDSWGLSRRAIGALVLIHESYHLRRPWSVRGDEGKVECAAIRHFRVGAMMLGATAEQATQLRAYALAFHWHLAAKFPAYGFKDCKVPRP